MQVGTLIKQLLSIGDEGEAALHLSTYFTDESESDGDSVGSSEGLLSPTTSKKKKKPEGEVKSCVLAVGGMSCAVCAGKVEKTLLSDVRTSSVAVSLATNRAEVRFGTVEEGGPAGAWGGSYVVDDCVKSIRDLGYKCKVLRVESSGGNDSAGGLSLADNAREMRESREEEFNSWKKMFLTSLFFTVPLVTIHYTNMYVPARLRSIMK